MDKTKGIAYCGLACCLCEHTEDCPGCKNNGCSGKDWCKSIKCCLEKGIDGCWQCGEYPCDNPMFKTPRARAFIRFILEHGEEAFMAALEKNEANGMLYHYSGELTGDYDKPETEEEIIELIIKGS